MPAILALVLTLIAAAHLRAQSSATPQGRVFDPSDAVIPGATITVRSQSTGFDRSVRGDAEGRYHVVAIPVGIYTVTAAAAGFRSERIDALTAEVGRILVRDFHVEITGSVDQWFDPSAFVAVDRFGGGSVRLQVRADVFDLFNYANLGPPGNIVGTPTFGKITRTRFPTGEAGSSRQVQQAAKLLF